jgi:hypothetical protein
MDCAVTINSVTPYGSPGGPLSSVVVTGTATTGCEVVEVTISCGGSTPIPPQTVYYPGGGPNWPWTATFNLTGLAGTGCTCGQSELLVQALCQKPRQCSNDRKLIPLTCLSCCPTITLTSSQGDCDSQGQRSVSFTVNVTPASDPSCPASDSAVLGTLYFGDNNNNSVAFSAQPNSPASIPSHSYPPGTYSVQIQLASPPGCKVTPTPLNVPACGSGGGGGCSPPWNPRCWASPCGALLAAALAAILAAGVLITLAGCAQGLNYWLDGFAAGTAVLGLALLYIWYRFCSTISVGFCATLNQVMNLMLILETIETVVVTILGVLAAGGVTEVLPCLAGAALTWGYYGSVIAALIEIAKLTNCPITAGVGTKG